jgi:uncharacterized protein YeaO (DUF488 family)
VSTTNSAAYRDELSGNLALDELRAMTRKHPVSPLYAARDSEQDNASAPAAILTTILTAILAAA